MKIYKLDAIILKSKDMREADKVITIYSVQRGKQRAVAHGAAKPNSKKRGAVQPFCFSNLVMHQGRDLDSVSQAELREGFTELRTDLDRLTAAAYMAELSDAFLAEGEPNQVIFGLLLSVLHLIAAGDAEMALRAFEARLLGLTGFRPELHRCSGCGEPIATTKVYFDNQQGCILCNKCATFANKTTVFNKGTVEVLKTLYRWELSKLHQLKVSNSLRKELSNLLRAYIEYHLEKRLKTAEFLDRLYKNSPGWGTNSTKD